jgi:hypothetical protein
MEYLLNNLIPSTYRVPPEHVLIDRTSTGQSCPPASDPSHPRHPSSMCQSDLFTTASTLILALDCSTELQHGFEQR